MPERMSVNLCCIPCHGPYYPFHFKPPLLFTRISHLMQPLCHTALILAISFIICLIVISSGAAPYYPSEGPVHYCSGSAGLHQTEHHLADPAQGCTKHQGHPATKPHLATITRSSRINRIGSWSDRPPPQEIIRSKPLDYRLRRK